MVLAEAATWAWVIEDLVAAAGEIPPALPTVGPTVADYVDAVAPTFSSGTAATYRSYWRVAIARLGDRPVRVGGYGGLPGGGSGHGGPGPAPPSRL